MQAVGKVLSEKPVLPGAIVNALRPIWCPVKGFECKKVGDNIFVFKFSQTGGWRKAVDGGPWTFD